MPKKANRDARMGWHGTNPSLPCPGNGHLPAPGPRSIPSPSPAASPAPQHPHPHPCCIPSPAASPVPLHPQPSLLHPPPRCIPIPSPALPSPGALGITGSLSQAIPCWKSAPCSRCCSWLRTELTLLCAEPPAPQRGHTGTAPAAPGIRGPGWMASTSHREGSGVRGRGSHEALECPRLSPAVPRAPRPVPTLPARGGSHGRTGINWNGNG